MCYPPPPPAHWQAASRRRATGAAAVLRGAARHDLLRGATYGHTPPTQPQLAGRAGLIVGRAGMTVLVGRWSATRRW